MINFKNAHNLWLALMSHFWDANLKWSIGAYILFSVDDRTVIPSVMIPDLLSVAMMYYYILVVHILAIVRTKEKSIKLNSLGKNLNERMWRTILKWSMDRQLIRSFKLQLVKKSLYVFFGILSKSRTRQIYFLSQFSKYIACLNLK